jgi:hypothetical protein
MVLPNSPKDGQECRSYIPAKHRFFMKPHESIPDTSVTASIRFKTWVTRVRLTPRWRNNVLRELFLIEWQQFRSPHMLPREMRETNIPP